MGKIKNILIVGFLLSLLVSGCYDDKGNYDYDFDNVPELLIDTSGMDQSVIWASWNVGDTIRIFPKVKYTGDTSNLIYRWFLLDYYYKPVEVGNTQIWPAADTICYTLDLNYVVDLEPSSWVVPWLMVKDTVNEITAYWQVTSYKVIPQAGSVVGIYCLQEKDGRVDIDIYSSSRALIMGGQYHVKDYYSTWHEEDPLTGDPLFISFSITTNSYYIFTTEQGLRVSPTEMLIMENWNEMFYTPPVYNPQAFININNCDFLINDNKLHVLYANESSSRKFAAYVPGDYQLFPYLATQTIQSYNPKEGAINAYQTVYDVQNKGFRAYFNKASALSQFKEPGENALFNVNEIEGEPVYVGTTYEGNTMLIVKKDGGYHIYVAKFYDEIDEGNLTRIAKPLIGCTDFDRHSHIITHSAGPAMFYSVDNKVYSYVYSSGEDFSKLLWEGEPGDEVTAFQWLGTGGFPTGGRVLWIAVWNESKNEGKIIEFEISPNTGEAELSASSISGINENPTIHTGFGKIKSMTYRM